MPVICLLTYSIFTIAVKTMMPRVLLLKERNFRT
nr:MAG TPA: hypothetical protein [Caudoviricetes sp.]